MTRNQKYAVGGGVVAAGLLAWWLWPKKAVARRKSELIIDANVYSPTYGEPIYGPPSPVLSPVQEAANRAADALDAFNREHPESQGGDYGRILGLIR